jgi:hypothetical protein
MKSILKILSIAIFAVMGVVSIATIDEYLVDFASSAGVISASCLPLVGLRRKCGPKPGGNKRLYLAPADFFEDVEFPTYTMLSTSGKITGTTIPLLEDMEFIEIQAAYDTTKWGFSSKGKIGSQSFEHNATFEVNGIDADSVRLATLFLNRPILIIAKGNNNTMYLVGSIDNPLELELTADSGAKGTDPQKITFTAKNDGYMTPIAPLDSAVVIPITPLPALV